MRPAVEELETGLEPAELVVENARRKARAGLAEAPDGVPVLGVDTEVELDGEVLGKAASEEDARHRLEALSGRTHTVLSGMVVIGRGEEERSGVARSQVSFLELDKEVVSLYLTSGEWRDRAGAYAIQGLGAILVERVEGDFSNVVGLPIRLLLSLVPGVLENSQSHL